MRLHLCRVGGCRKRAPTEFGFHFEPLLKRKDELALFRNLTLGSTDWRATLPAAGATSSEFGIVLHPVAPGYIRRQGSRPASVGGIWLSFSALVENKGSDWVRFVIRFWFVGVECRQMNIAAVCGRTFPQFRRSCCVLLHLCVARSEEHTSELQSL